MNSFYYIRLDTITSNANLFGSITYVQYISFVG